MASQLRSREFRDISLSFEPHPVTKDIPILRDTACIRKSVSNIVQTIRGERFFDSLFGSNVRRSLFDFVDFATASVIEREITEAILNFCLLYTSPSPRDLSTSRMPSSA